MYNNLGVMQREDLSETVSEDEREGERERGRERETGVEVKNDRDEE